VRFLLDTHIWLWSLLEPTKLSQNVRDVLQDSHNEFFLSPITVWETLILAEKNRIKLDRAPEEWVVKALKSSPVQEVPLTHTIAIKSRSVVLPHEDPADRFIAATAQNVN
jgi:PIN domain nuclease of toxin-antitoxin system